LTLFLVLLNDPTLPKIPESAIQFGDVIGTGGQGFVYKAIYKGKPVAAKTLLITNDVNTVKFAQEAKTLSLCKHKNVLEFIGVVISVESNKIYMVSELMDSDLTKVASRLTLEEKIRVLKEIASGM
jgi:serine/threonine protein kinase